MPRRTASSAYSPWPHRTALAVCCAAFPLVWVGGLVTTYDAGMAVPDWPSTFGYNLFLYPWQTWIAGPFDLFIEHGHRLLGAAVGILSMALVAVAFRCDQRRGIRAAAVVLLALVILQGLLGGMRVWLDERLLAMGHACLGLATFAFSAAMVVLTSRYWREATDGKENAGAGITEPHLQQTGGRILRLAVLTAALVYVQVVLGAMLRHVPVAASPGFFRLAVLFHVVVGLAVLFHLVALALRGWQVAQAVPRVGTPIGLAVLLVVCQIMLGGATWVLKYGWPSWFADLPFAAAFTVQANSLLQAMVTTLHVAVGALILALSVVIALRAWLFFRPPVWFGIGETLAAARVSGGGRTAECRV